MGVSEERLVVSAAVSIGQMLLQVGRTHFSNQHTNCSTAS